MGCAMDWSVGVSGRLEQGEFAFGPARLGQRRVGSSTEDTSRVGGAASVRAESVGSRVLVDRLRASPAMPTAASTIGMGV
jgi:hypothetical protein